MRNKIVVGDADALIALAHQDDANHVRAKKVSKWLVSRGYEIFYPNTTIIEAITTLKRSMDLVAEAHLLNRQYQKGAFLVEFIGENIQKRASSRFEETVSKKNTIFDAIVVETAVELGADYIFSFDSWYRKEGFHLAGD